MWGAGLEKVRKNPAESHSRSIAAALLQRSVDCATEGSLANTKYFVPVVDPRQRIRYHGKKERNQGMCWPKDFCTDFLQQRTFTSFNKHLHFWKPWTPHSTSCSKRGLLIFVFNIALSKTAITDLWQKAIPPCFSLSSLLPSVSATLIHSLVETGLRKAPS